MLTALGRLLLFIRHPHAPARLSPMHIGFLFGMYHFLLINACVLAVWWYFNPLTWLVEMTIIPPLLSVVLWVWLTQSLLTVYRPITVHDALIIAKWSLWPLLGLLVVCGLLLVLYQSGLVLNQSIAVFFYIGFLSSLGLFFVGFSVIPFSLLHPLTKKYA